MIDHEPLSGWKLRPLSEMLVEQDLRAGALDPGERTDLEVLSLTKRQGLVPQSQRFDKRVATKNIDRYKVVRRGWIAYNPYVVWEGAIHALHRQDPGAVSPAYVVWRRTEDDGGFLDFLLRSPQMLAQYQALSHGAVNRRRTINKRDFLSIEVPAPPIEQQRLLAKLLRHVRGAAEAHRRLSMITEELRAALTERLLSHGLRGERRRLTEIGPVPESWQVRPLERLLREPLRNGHSAVASTDGTGIRTLTLSAVTQRDFAEHNTKVTVAAPDRVRNMWLEPGDILVERANTPEYVGLAALYEGQRDYAIYPDLMIRVRVDRQAISPYLVVQSLLGRQNRLYFRRNARATSGNFPKIDQGTVERALIPVPGVDEQREIERILRAAEAKAEAHIRGSRTSTALQDSLVSKIWALTTQTTEPTRVGAVVG